MAKRGSSNQSINMLKQLPKYFAIKKFTAAKQNLGMRTVKKKVASGLSLKLLQVGHIEKELRNSTM